eukprot:5568394-Pyramimonas_sp.AAC.1
MPTHPCVVDWRCPSPRRSEGCRGVAEGAADLSRVEKEQAAQTTFRSSALIFCDSTALAAVSAPPPPRSARQRELPNFYLVASLNPLAHIASPLGGRVGASLGGPWEAVLRPLGGRVGASWGLWWASSGHS